MAELVLAELTTHVITTDFRYLPNHFSGRIFSIASPSVSVFSTESLQQQATSLLNPFSNASGGSDVETSKQNIIRWDDENSSNDLDGRFLKAFEKELTYSKAKLARDQTFRRSNQPVGQQILR